MTELIQFGPSDDLKKIPNQPLGVIFYEALKHNNPSSTILIDGETGERICRVKLLETSVKLAIKLERLGVKTDDVLTIVSENNAKYPITILAGLYLGLQINLLNHDYTSGELKHFLSMCKPTAVFCTKKSLDNIVKLKNEAFYPNNVFIYDGETSDHAENFDDFLSGNLNLDEFTPTALDPQERVAFILTSSGTTGFPKGVQITHANYRISMLYTGDPSFVDFNEAETTVGFLPFFHIFGNVIIMASIFYGTKCVLLEKFVPDKFLTIIEEHKVTKLLTVPAILLFFVKSPLVDKYDCSSVKDVMYGAAPCSKELTESVKRKLKITSVRQVYGMTETTGAVAIETSNLNGKISAMKATFTNSIKVCDPETGRALSSNEVGELRIKGRSVMRGYIGNKKETEEIFDDDGFLKTGDLGYYDDEGGFYIVDRLKEIIKYKGFQVSPAELESLLIQYPGVKDAGVVGVPDERSGEVPLAFVVKQPDKHVTAEEIIKYVDEHISVQKRLYGGVRFVDEIPKNVSGKILRHKLKELLKVAS